MTKPTKRNESKDQSESQSGWSRHGWLAMAIASQLITIAITFPTWQVRESPINLPWLDVPQIPYLFSVGMIVSTLGCFWLRRSGSWIHLAILVLACVWDQFRIQPQFFFGWVFLWAASDIARQQASGLGVTFCRWALIALWFWAGFHKLYSPEWLGHKSCEFLWRMKIGELAQQIHVAFAILVGGSEVALAILALLRPKWAAWFCPILHLGILSSLVIADWNYSVYGWNIMAAILGFLIFAKHHWTWPAKEWAVAAIVLVPPFFFYYGYVDRAFAMVLYSGMTPVGQITHADDRPEKFETIRGWGKLAVPFPKERRTLRQYFELTASVGSKLHIQDKRSPLKDDYFVKQTKGIKRISRREFYASSDSIVSGYEIDDHSSNFHFRLADVDRLKRSENEMVYAIAFTPENYSRELLKLISGYPSLEQIQLQGCEVTDDDLRFIQGLHRLEGIGLNQTNITDSGLDNLRDLPRLNLLQINGTKISVQHQKYTLQRVKKQ